MSLMLFKAMEYKYQIPAFLEKVRNQHSVEGAIDSILVYKGKMRCGSVSWENEKVEFF